VVANIFGTRFLGRREPAWHGLGETFETPMTATEAFTAAGLMYEVKTVPLVMLWDGEKADNVKDGHVDSGLYAVVRGPTADDPVVRVFGHVSPKYVPLQNSQIAKSIDPLTTEWPVETVGALGQGETTFTTLYCGESDVKGDMFRKYILITEGKNGGQAVRAKYCEARVVCQNTLEAALAEVSFGLTIPHTPDAEKQLEFRVALMYQTRKAAERVHQALEFLAEKRLAEDQVSTALQLAYPDPNMSQRAIMAASLGDDAELVAKEMGDQHKPFMDALMAGTRDYEYGRDRAEVFRAGARELYVRFNDEFPVFAGTGYSLLQAIIECEDYRKGGKDTSVKYSATFGPRAKTKARGFAAVMQV
jgi:phage/plasmid-like protein (TIGR03299 family)